MISVIIPTHNRVGLLKRAINSVLAQTYKDIEIIIISDGSTDGTSTFVNNLQKTDARIKYHEYFPSKGGNYARNKGILESKGDYIAFLDDDDEWLSEKLEKQLSIFDNNHKIGITYTGVRIIYVNEKIEYSFIGNKRGDLSKEILLDNCIGTTSTVMIRREVLEKTGLFDLNLYALQDFDLWIRVCQYCLVDVVKEELVKYYNYTGSKQVSGATEKYINAFKFINEKYKDLHTSLSQVELKKKKINEYMLLANKAMRNGDNKLSRKYITELSNYGFSLKGLVYLLLTYTSFKTVLKFRSKL